METKPLVSVLILTYNRSDLLKDCLDFVLKSDYPNLEFLVVDNGSAENITQFVKDNYSNRKISVHRLDPNKGLTGGFNFGFQFCKGKYIMLLSNDTKLDKRAISLMVEMAQKDPKIGIVSPKIIQMRKPKYLHNVGSFMTYSGLLYHYGIEQSKDRKSYQKPYYIFSCNGSGFLIRKETLDESGPFDQDFVFCYDDTDLSHRVWLCGYTVVYCPKAELQHLWSATINPGNNLFWFYNHRNHMISLIKELALPNLVVMFLNFQISLITWFFLNLIKGRFDVITALPKSYVYVIKNFDKILKQRKFIQDNLRKTSDEEIFKKTLVSPSWKYYLIHFHIMFKDKALPSRVMYKVPKQ